MSGSSRPDEEYRYLMATEGRAIDDDDGFAEQGVSKRRRNHLLVASCNLWQTLAIKTERLSTCG